MHGPSVRALRLRAVLVGAGALLAIGCTGSPIGDPCVPESVPAGGYDMREIYIETSSVQCRTRTCMVYQLQGNPEELCDEDGADPETCAAREDVDTQIFCSCRCSVAAGGQANTPLCNCGDGFTCIDDIVTTGGEGVRGGYCVPCIREGDTRNLPSPPFAACPTPS